MITITRAIAKPAPLEPISSIRIESMYCPGSGFAIEVHPTIDGVHVKTEHGWTASIADFRKFCTAGLEMLAEMEAGR